MEINLSQGYVDWYIENNFFFCTEKKYKGILGKILTYFERRKIQKLEDRDTGEKYWVPDFHASDPRTFETYFPLYLKEHQENNFSVYLCNLILKKNLDHVEVYKNAHIDRKLFSKIRTNVDYIPSKKTVLALALGMKLNLEETSDLLHAAGYHLSKKILFDVMIGFFLEEKIYDIELINEWLFRYKQPIF